MAADRPIPADPSIIVCPRCAAPNAADADFCDECGRPLSATAALDPIKAIQTEGFMFRQMASGRRSWLILLGAWLMSLPGVLFYGASVRTGEPVAVLFTVITAGLGGVLLYKATANYLRRRGQTAGA